MMKTVKIKNGRGREEETLSISESSEFAQVEKGGSIVVICLMKVDGWVGVVL
jgi:hypothetical protein